LSGLTAERREWSIGHSQTVFASVRLHIDRESGVKTETLAGSRCLVAPARSLNGAKLGRSRRRTMPLQRGLLTLLMLSVSAGPTGSTSGFGFCAPPSPPACIDDDSAYANEPRSKDCRESVSRYVDRFLAYRTCLLHETERTVLETNMAIHRFKCGLKLKRRCSDEDARQNK
jgi:hypothetical protein